MLYSWRSSPASRDEPCLIIAKNSIYERVKSFVVNGASQGATRHRPPPPPKLKWANNWVDRRDVRGRVLQRHVELRWQGRGVFRLVTWRRPIARFQQGNPAADRDLGPPKFFRDTGVELICRWSDRSTAFFVADQEDAFLCFFSDQVEQLGLLPVLFSHRQSTISHGAGIAHWANLNVNCRPPRPSCRLTKSTIEPGTSFSCRSQRRRSSLAMSSETSCDHRSTVLKETTRTGWCIRPKADFEQWSRGQSPQRRFPGSSARCDRNRRERCKCSDRCHWARSRVISRTFASHTTPTPQNRGTHAGADRFVPGLRDIWNRSGNPELVVISGS
jgi:hypothetical protein